MMARCRMPAPAEGKCTRLHVPRPASPRCPPLGPGRRGAPCHLAGRLRGGQAGAASVPGAGHHVCAGGGGAGPAAAPARHAAVCGLRGAAPRLLAHLRAAQVGGVSYCWHLRCLQAWRTRLSAVARQALRAAARQLLRRPNKLLQQAGCHHPAFRTLRAVLQHPQLHSLALPSPAAARWPPGCMESRQRGARRSAPSPSG